MHPFANSKQNRTDTISSDLATKIIIQVSIPPWLCKNLSFRLKEPVWTLLSTLNQPWQAGRLFCCKSGNTREFVAGRKIGKVVDSLISLEQILLNDIAGYFSVWQSLKLFISSCQQKLTLCFPLLLKKTHSDTKPYDLLFILKKTSTKPWASSELNKISRTY